MRIFSGPGILGLMDSNPAVGRTTPFLTCMIALTMARAPLAPSRCLQIVSQWNRNKKQDCTSFAVNLPKVGLDRAQIHGIGGCAVSSQDGNESASFNRISSSSSGTMALWRNEIFFQHISKRYVLR